ncbi:MULTISPECIES: DUF4878 domain-containing protein [Terrisporobacter]|uniref:DUF4878 domain-containing protein n=1 Tax=Terrisporobacter othiniensis TaxID=1577792 RepID=A0A0B3VHR3_9FIRM|nr:MULTISPECIES: DUF4878 domain-containing protein [Terrisporobacter]KHS56336.1 hypothetical protein QX51_14790 [Terrisporobacter othiniensis]MCC3668602.1 DUF4878 domain-containing protein [Terrisporobacter mayombei]
MKKTVLALLMIMLFIPMMLTGCKSETPTDVVNTYFSSIKKSDSKEAQKLIEDTISDEILNEETGTTSTQDETSETSKKEDGQKLDESLKMYLSKIDAKVLSEKVNEDKAIVKVEIKAPNYSNLLLAVMEESIADTFNGKEVKQADVEKNLEEKIKSSKAETRSGQINLTKKDNEWKIKSDENITNLLLGEADEKESVMFSK